MSEAVLARTPPAAATPRRSPLMQRRLDNFHANRRGTWSL